MVKGDMFLENVDGVRPAIAVDTAEDADEL